MVYSCRSGRRLMVNSLDICFGYVSSIALIAHFTQFVISLKFISRQDRNVRNASSSQLKKSSMIFLSRSYKLFIIVLIPCFIKLKANGRLETDSNKPGPSIRQTLKKMIKSM
jgi:hypothetical protein